MLVKGATAVISALKIHMSHYAQAALDQLGGYNIILRGEMPIKVSVLKCKCHAAWVRFISLRNHIKWKGPSYDFHLKLELYCIYDYSAVPL